MLTQADRTIYNNNHHHHNGIFQALNHVRRTILIYQITQRLYQLQYVHKNEQNTYT